MAWGAGWPPIEGVGLPTPGGTKRREYKIVMKLWKAVQERQWMFNNNPIWPRVATIWAEGIITSLVDNEDGTWTLTDSTKAAAPTGQPDVGYYWNGGRIFPACCGPNHWVGLSCTTCSAQGMPYIPAFFDVIIQHTNGEVEWYRDQEPWANIRGDITSSTSQSLTFIAKLENYAVAKVIPSTAALVGTEAVVGARYYIIRTGGLWWADRKFAFGRWPDWPNHAELWRGTISATDTGKMFDNGQGYIQELTQKIQNVTATPWTIDMWKTKEVLAYTTASDLKRTVVTSSNRNTVFFGGLLAIPTAEEESEMTVEYVFTGEYTIVPPGSRGFPERKSGRSGWWFGGAQATVTTHDPSDQLVPRSLAFAAPSVTWRELLTLIPYSCEQDDAIKTEYTVLDNDIWSHIQNMCTSVPGGADFCFSPHLFKSFRQIQVETITLIERCVRPISYTNAKEIPPYSIAQCFHDCAINSGVVATQYETVGANTVYYITVAPAYAGHGIYWDASFGGIRKAKGQSASDITGKVILATILTATDDLTWRGNTVVYSAGFTRWRRLEFWHMYPRGAFIPTLNVTEDGSSAVFPPEVLDFELTGCVGVGTWHWEEISTGYKLFDSYGYALDNAVPFVAGKAARYTGDNWLDPGTTVTFRGSDDATLAPYWDKFYEGQHPPDVQVRMRKQRMGLIESATPFSVTVKEKNWYESWYPTTPTRLMRTETGLATGGSSTTLVTTASLTDTTNVAHCMWQADRFLGSLFGGKPYKNFILEVDKQEEDPEDNEETITRTYKMVITDVTNNTEGNAPVLHFAAQLNSSGSPLIIVEDDVWRIPEPATNLHRFRGRRVRIYPIDGAPFELDITHSDNNTLFFATQTDPAKFAAKNWGAEIIEYDTGGVWKFQTTEPTALQKATLRWQKVGVGKYWVQPIGPDPRDADDPWHYPTHENMTENFANLHPKMFGLIQKGDSINRHVEDELYALLNRIVWTKAIPTWTANGENNVNEPFIDPGIGASGFSDQAGADAMWAYMIGEGDVAIASNTPTSAEGQPPYVHTAGSLEATGSYIEVGRAYSYAKDSGVPNLMAHSTEFYNYAILTADNLELGTLAPAPPTHGHKYEFINDGDPVAHRVWTSWNETAPVQDDEVLSTKLGDIDLPEWVSQPEWDSIDGTQYVNRNVGGYYASGVVAIRKWNVPGGLRYVGSEMWSPFFYGP